MVLIWDNLPDCILDKIYSKVIYRQPNDLLEDIKSYALIINFIKINYRINNDILWNLILYNERKLDNKEINDLYIKWSSIEDYDTISYDIKKYVIKMSKNERYNFITRYLYAE